MAVVTSLTTPALHATKTPLASNTTTFAPYSAPWYSAASGASSSVTAWAPRGVLNGAARKKAAAVLGGCRAVAAMAAAEDFAARWATG
ncbi:hypothetical protein OOU_Y34scaffold00516g1 [Pyricularia oryzae Y34]|uniref:Uncharacterized protein n=2 Tax=Pyricularia oryzae TaxID=318829 RepID=A0AA97NZ52_PYRO3|nr:hypothetical protein OOU_Y34scaffold00516g1 [Pyricularia oryzae Y34]